MSSNASETGRPHNPTHFGGDGLYDQSRVAAGGRSSRAERPAASTFDFVKRNPLPLLAVGGLAWLLITLIRKSTQG